MAEVTNDTRKFLINIYRATQDNRLAWSARSQSAFELQTSAGNITLSARDEDDRHPILLRVTNPGGVSVVDLISGEGDLSDEDDDLIFGLYQRVKDNALGISSTLDSISEALNLEE